MDYSIHPLADKEVGEIFDYYDEIDESLGDEFLSDLQNAISRVLPLSRSLAESMAVSPPLFIQPFSLRTGLPEKARRYHDSCSNASSSRTELLDRSPINHRSSQWITPMVSSLRRKISKAVCRLPLTTVSVT